MLRRRATLVLQVATIAVGSLFILALYSSLPPERTAIPGPSAFGVLPVPVGSFSLFFRKIDGTSTATHWAAFKFIMNSTKSYRLMGAWSADRPTWAGSGQLFWFEEGMPTSCPEFGCPPPWTWPHHGLLDQDFILWPGCGYDHGVLVPTKAYNETRVVFFVSPGADQVTVTQPIVLQEIPTTRQCPPTVAQL